MPKSVKKAINNDVPGMLKMYGRNDDGYKTWKFAYISDKELGAKKSVE